MGSSGVWLISDNSITFNKQITRSLLHKLSGLQMRVEVIQNCFRFALLCSVIDKKNSRHLLNQSNAKPKSIMNLRVFPRLALVTCISSNSDWFLVLFSSVVIGQSDYFGFGFITLS